MARILAVCRSDTKGVPKGTVESAVLRADYGLVDDAHADSCTHRQISLLATESIDKMRRFGLDVTPGSFAENLTTEGIDLCHLPVGTTLGIGEDLLLEITQIGKECHIGCAIFQQVGQCIMPSEGVFARVIHGGMVKPGDSISVRRNV